jgi:hypothetical protein
VANDDLKARESSLRDEIEQVKVKENEEKAKLRVQINNEKKLTEEAVKKLFQIVQEKKPKNNGNVKNASETKRLEKEYKRLQLELSKERESYAQMHKALNQEIQAVKEELDKREQEIVKFKLLLNNNSNNVNNSLHHALVNTVQNYGGGGGASPMNSAVNLSSYSLTSSSINHYDDSNEYDSQDRLESWLSIPNKRNIKKHGWKKLYVVLKKGKLYFYNSLRDMKESQEPYMTIDLE